MSTNLKNSDFTNKLIFVGIDVHVKTWHITAVSDLIVKKLSFPPDAEKLANYLTSTFPNGKYLCGYEAGCFGFKIKEDLESFGVSCVVINPADVPTSGKDRVGKTDARDSKKIALALQAGLLEPIYVPSKKSQEDRDLLRRRFDLVKKITRIKNQIKAQLKFYGIKYTEEYLDGRSHWSKNFIKWLQTIEFATSSCKIKMISLVDELEFLIKEKLKITRALRKLVRGAEYSETFRLCKSVAGLGETSAITVALEVIDITRFRSQDKFTSYIGLIPTENSSGEKQRKGHLTRRCNVRLRTVIIEAAWVAVRTDPAMTTYFNECTKTMKKTNAIIKVARKLANRLRYILINKQEYAFALIA